MALFKAMCDLVSWRVFFTVNDLFVSVGTILSVSNVDLKTYDQQ